MLSSIVEGSLKHEREDHPSSGILPTYGSLYTDFHFIFVMKLVIHDSLAVMTLCYNSRRLAKSSLPQTESLCRGLVTVLDLLSRRQSNGVSSAPNA